MTDTISSVEATIVNGDVVTKTTETKTVNKEFSSKVENISDYNR